MTYVPVLVAAAMLAVPSVAAPDADARRGAEFFTTQKCDNCHAAGNVRNAGANIAPDLTRTLDRDYTPAGVTARMWNHAPAMWASMSKAGIATPNVTADSAADLFAFLYAARYFEKPGDAGRGRRAFEAKHCADCHAIGQSKATGGPTVAEWRSIADPIALVDQMWNHAPKMKAEMAARKLKWPELTAQELTDILVYVRNVPGSADKNPDLVLPQQAAGEQLFQAKGCAECHQGATSLERRLQNQTLTEVAAAVWNHAPKMKQATQPISVDEMRQLIGFLWARQFFTPLGDPERGKRVFEAKRCAGCHASAPGVPSLPAMVAALWKHGPKMLNTMEQKGVDWPLLTAPEVSSLVAFLAKSK